MTKIFCDIADINLIKKFDKKNIVKGFTTNPSLMRKAGAKNYAKYSKDILKVTKKPVSCEVFADDAKNMILQGKKINSWGKNVYVKVPIVNSKNSFTGKVINKASKSAKRCVEIASGAPLTEEEKNATKKSEINRECPSIANPNYVPY